MLPESEDNPAGVFERLGVLLVTTDVPIELGRPEAHIVFRTGAVQRALVPEAAINENSNFLLWEDHIGS